MPLFGTLTKIGQFSRSSKKNPGICPPFTKKWYFRTNLHSMRKCVITNISLQVAD